MALLEQPGAEIGDERRRVAVLAMLGRRVDGPDPDPGRRGAAEAGERHGLAAVLPQPEAAALARRSGCRGCVPSARRPPRDRGSPRWRTRVPSRGAGRGPRRWPLAAPPGALATSRTAVSPYTPWDRMRSAVRPLARREPFGRRLDERHVAHDAGDLGVVRQRPPRAGDPSAASDDGIAEHEVERLGPDGRRHRLVPVPNDPEVDDVVGVRARRQGPGDPERELVAGLVAFEQRAGEAQELHGVTGSQDLHRTMLAGGQSDHRPASSASTPFAAASGAGAPERSSVAST